MKRGFTIIEVLTATFILTVGAGAAFALATQTTSAAPIAKSQLVGAYLAQEGIEIIRNIRDTNTVANSTWDMGLTGCSGGCGANYNDAQLSGTLANEYLVFDNNEKRYVHNAVASSGFYRRIFVTKIDAGPGQNGDYLDVRVEVSWEVKGSAYQRVAYTRLYDWAD